MTNATDAKFWAGGARKFHNPDKKDKTRIGFLTYFNRLFPLFKPFEIDQRLFVKKNQQFFRQTLIPSEIQT